MRFKEPRLSLEFISDDLEETHPRTTTIEPDGILARSISIEYQLFSELKSSSNQAHLAIIGNLPVVEDIIATEGDIRAVLSDENRVVFTGYLSTSFSWTVTEHGEPALSLTIEDVGTRRLEMAFITEGVHLFDCSVIDVARRIAERTGITIASNFPPLVDEVTRLVSAGETCKDLLTQLLYEAGHVYMFNEKGELDAWRIDQDVSEDIPLIGADRLYSVGGSAITLSKKLRQHGGARIGYMALGKAENYLVYRNTTGKGDGHPYCHMPLKPGEVFNGSEIYTPEDGEDVIQPRIEAVNAAGENDVVGSGKIVSISNLRPSVSTESGYIEVSMRHAGGPYIEMEVRNKGHLTFHVERMDAYADIVYEKSRNIIRAGDELSSGSKALLEEDLEWIHDKQKASEHANLVAQYHRHAGAEYSFYSTEDIHLGDLVRIADTIHSGLVVPVLVFAKTVTDESDVAIFRAVAMEPFNLAEKVFIEQLVNKGGPQKGEDGKDGESYSIIIHSLNGSIFRIDNIETRLSCQVLKNTEDITESLEDWRFTWKRNTGNDAEDERWNTSSKAIGHKEIEITTEDCIGRTVFTCTVEL